MNAEFWRIIQRSWSFERMEELEAWAQSVEARKNKR